MGLYEKMLERLVNEAEKCGSVSELARLLGASRATFHKVIRKDVSPSAKTFCEWLDRLGAEIVFPDGASRNAAVAVEPAATPSPELASSLRKCEMECARLQGMLCVLERQNKEYRDMLMFDRRSGGGVRQGASCGDAGENTDA